VNVLGINAVFHDPAAALVVDGLCVAAAEEERFSRRKHGKDPVPFSTWELPVRAARWCLAKAGLRPDQLDAIAYSYDPALALSTGADHDLTAGEWEGLRTLFVRRAPRFLATALPGLEPDRVRFVAHHVAHAASAHLAAPHPSSAVLVVDGRGERTSHLAGHAHADGSLEVLATQALPHSLGLLYEELTAHLGFRRSSDEYKVMAMASYGRPAHLDVLREHMAADATGGFRAHLPDWHALAPALTNGDDWTPGHADLARSVQERTEEVLLELTAWLHERTGERALTMAGGVALNCVANSRLWREGPFDDVWVQPAAGDAGTALGAALHVAHALGEDVQPIDGVGLGPSWTDAELEGWLRAAGLEYERSDAIADAVAAELADDGIVAWFQGSSEFGPRALGHRSLLADPRRAANLERLNDIKGREQFRPVAPMVAVDRARAIFDGPLPSPYMLFTHVVDERWAARIPAVVHVDGTARVQTVDPLREPLVAAMLDAFDARTGVPVVVNTSLNTAGRPMVDDPRDALECLGSAPIDMLAIGSFVVRRRVAHRRSARAAGELAA
jgi:carbamoyltransferase